MRKQVQAALMTLAVMAIVSGCHGAGRISETYVNQKDTSQVLELTTKQTVKGMIGGGLVSPQGSYILQAAQKVTSGEYSRVNSGQHPAGAEPLAYVLKLDDNSELKLWLLAGATSLRDDAGNIWKLQSRSHDWRGSGPEEPTVHLRAIR